MTAVTGAPLSSRTGVRIPPMRLAGFGRGAEAVGPTRQSNATARREDGTAGAKDLLITGSPSPPPASSWCRDPSRHACQRSAGQVSGLWIGVGASVGLWGRGRRLPSPSRHPAAVREMLQKLNSDKNPL